MQKEINDLLGRKGIPVYGVSAPKKFAGVPRQFTPENILKDTRSVLCYAVPIPRGILHAENDSSLLFWRLSNMTYRFLDTVSNEICMLLDSHGHLAAPIYSCFPWKVHENKFHGLLPLAYLAQSCGIGSLTRSGLLGSARFGTRMILGGVITSAVLEETGEEPADLCPRDCFLCRDACPASAIGNDGRVDHNSCIRHSGSNPLLAHLLADRNIKARFDFETLLNTVSVDDHGTYTCSKCLEACPLNQ